jgi:hypothetical protein
MDDKNIYNRKREINNLDSLENGYFDDIDLNIKYKEETLVDKMKMCLLCCCCYPCSIKKLVLKRIINKI